MKKRIALLLTAALALSSFCACGSGNTTTGSSSAASSSASTASDSVSDQEAADKVAALIDAIYVQERTDTTDEQCAEAKKAWDALTDKQKELVE